jgi:hypothetical protein
VHCGHKASASIERLIAPRSDHWGHHKPARCQPCAVTCRQSVRFYRGLGRHGPERRATIAEHRWPITTPAPLQQLGRVTGQPVEGIVTNRATRWSCKTRLGSLIRGPNRPPEVALAAIDRVEGGIAPPPPTPPDMRATHPAVRQANRSLRHRVLMLCRPIASQYRLFKARPSGGEFDMRQGPLPVPAHRRAS